MSSLKIHNVPKYNVQNSYRWMETSTFERWVFTRITLLTMTVVSGIQPRPPHDAATCSLCGAPLPWAQWLSGKSIWLVFRRSWIQIRHLGSILNTSQVQHDKCIATSDSTIYREILATVLIWQFGDSEVNHQIKKSRYQIRTDTCMVPSRSSNKCARVRRQSYSWLSLRSHRWHCIDFSRGKNGLLSLRCCLCGVPNTSEYIMTMDIAVNLVGLHVLRSEVTRLKCEHAYMACMITS